VSQSSFPGSHHDRRDDVERRRIGADLLDLKLRRERCRCGARTIERHEREGDRDARERDDARDAREPAR
jgi:hypothetical protein